jgi:hypothetical protein
MIDWSYATPNVIAGALIDAALGTILIAGCMYLVIRDRERLPRRRCRQSGEGSADRRVRGAETAPLRERIQWKEIIR